jgi:hypothetical protein
VFQRVFDASFVICLQDPASKDKAFSPVPTRSCFKRFRRITHNGLSTYVERVVYSKRKSAGKRKLQFGETGECSMKNIKKANSSENEAI